MSVLRGSPKIRVSGSSRGVLPRQEAALGGVLFTFLTSSWLSLSWPISGVHVPLFSVLLFLLALLVLHVIIISLSSFL